MKLIKHINILFFISTFIFASGGSTYTRYGIGDLFFTNSAQQLSLGGLGISLSDQQYINTNNPATWSNIKDTKFNAGINMKLSNISDITTSALYDSYRFLGFNIGLPIQKDFGMSLVLGTSPYSVVNYDVINTTSSDELGSYEEKFIGNGGISKIYIGASTNLIYGISTGVMFNYFTGNISRTSSFDFIDNSTFLTSNFKNEEKIKGIGGSFGVLSPDFAELFKISEINNLRIGFSYDFATKLSSDTSYTIRTSLEEKQISSGTKDLEIPSKLSLGLSFDIDNRYLFNLDFSQQAWSNFKDNNILTNNLQDLSIIAVGFEYAKGANQYSGFWEQIRYRCGLSFEQGQYAINGVGIDQLGIHAGFTVPLGYNNSIDFGFMYGNRGTTDSNLLKENIFQTSVTLNFGELWFIRRDR